MSHGPIALGKSQRSNTAELAGHWAGDVALAAAVGAAYLLVAKIVNWGTVFQPGNFAVFWPPAGVSCGRKPFTAMTALGYAIQPYMERIAQTADQARISS